VTSAKKTPLMYAVETGSYNICEYLLQKRAKPDIMCHKRQNGYSNGWTALHFACDLGDFKLLELLIRNGARMDIESPDGDTALTIAAESGRFNLVMWMVRNGAYVNARRRQLNPTQWAVFRADPDTVKFLVSHGGQPKLDAKVLWFDNNESLEQRIRREFDPEIIKRIYLAIYRGEKLLRRRANMIDQLGMVKWLGPKQGTEGGGETQETRMFPGLLMQIITAFNDEKTELDEKREADAEAERLEKERARPESKQAPKP